MNPSTTAPRLIVRADGNARIGLGHVVRSMAVADIVRGQFAEVVLASQAPLSAVRQAAADYGFSVLELREQPARQDAEQLKRQLGPADVVMLDGPSFDTVYQRVIRAKGNRLVVIDDLAQWPVEADLIINHGPSATPSLYKALPTTRYCLGPAFTMLRREFRDRAQHPQPVPEIRSLLVCFGGADPKRLTYATLWALLKLEQIKQIGLVVGAANEHFEPLQQLAVQHPHISISLYQQATAAQMADLLTQYHAVACPASTVLLETLVLGQAAITGYYVPDQRRLAHYVHEHRQAFSMGDLTALTPTAFAEALYAGICFHEQTLRAPYVQHLAPEKLQVEFSRLAL